MACALIFHRRHGLGDLCFPLPLDLQPFEAAGGSLMLSQSGPNYERLMAQH